MPDRQADSHTMRDARLDVAAAQPRVCLQHSSTFDDNVLQQQASSVSEDCRRASSGPQRQIFHRHTRSMCAERAAILDPLDARVVVARGLEIPKSPRQLLQLSIKLLASFFLLQRCKSGPGMQRELVRRLR